MMTTAPLPKTAPALPIRPPAAAASGGTPSIDVAKILKKYAWVLVAALVFGLGLGTVAHFVLRKVYPIFQVPVYFQVLGAQEDFGDIGANKDEDEQERFALTQVAEMRSDAVIQRVVSDPRLQAQAPKWAAMFRSGGGFQAADAAEWLQDHISARLVPNTDIIELRLGWKDAANVTAVVGFIKEIYMIRLEEQTRGRSAPQRDALEKQIGEYEKRYRDKQTTRDQLLRDDKVDSLEQRFAADNMELQTIIRSMHEVRISIEGTRTQLARYERELNSQGGPTYSDELISAIEAEPMIQNIQQTIASLEAQKAAMQHRGIGPEHRSMATTEALIASWKAKLQEQRERLLRKRFDAIVDSMRGMMETLSAQGTDLSGAQEQLVLRLIDLSKTMVKVDDLDQEIEGIVKAKAEMESQLQTLSSMNNLATAKRVIVSQSERKPDRPVFPNILIMIPAGAVLCLGLTTGVVFLRELLDQRVKGPGDVAMIPRTRVLGYVPDASEDPATSADRVHRAFHNTPKGVLAESFRQVRSPLLKQIDLAGHKTVMVMAGLPGSGTSTVVTNLADAAAASGRKTLIVDANFRRPSQHKALNVGAAPGLADILAGESTLQAAACGTDSPNLSVIPAGTPASRIVERLAGERFVEFLAAAAADYDLVFIDVPPVIVSGDGLSIANRCDASVLVVKAYAEKRGLVSRIRNELADARSEFLGVIVNGVKASAGGYLRGNIRASQAYAGDAA